MKINLSEIPKDTMLWVYRHDYSDCELMSKQDFVNDFASRVCCMNKNEYNYFKLYLAKEYIIKFDIKDYIKNLSEDAFEDWDERMIDNIGKENIDLINKILNDASKKNIVYYDGEEVNIND